MRVVDFSRLSLWRDLCFVGGVLTGIGAGGLMGYALGWERTLGLVPGVLSLPFVVLMLAGQEMTLRAVRRSRQMGEDKPQDAGHFQAPQ